VADLDSPAKLIEPYVHMWCRMCFTFDCALHRPTPLPADLDDSAPLPPVCSLCVGLLCFVVYWDMCV
jgi:hypothetical protein